MKNYPVTPVAKPRMTRADRWKKRPATEKYWRFKDEVRLLGVTVPDSGSHVTFIIPMPKSWSKKKKLALDGQPHRQRPDVDNLAKALLDAIFDEDAGVWDIRVTKLWGGVGSINVKEG